MHILLQSCGDDRVGEAVAAYRQHYGMRGLGVLWGYGTRDELETAGADQLVDSPADLAVAIFSMVNGKQSQG